MTLVSRVFFSAGPSLCLPLPFFRAVEAGAQVPSAVAQVMPWGPELPGGVMALSSRRERAGSGGLAGAENGPEDGAAYSRPDAVGA